MINYTPEEIHQHGRQWLKALRSGTYPQGFTQLVTYDPVRGENDKPTGYCCLGVAQVEANTNKYDIDVGFTSDIQGFLQYYTVNLTPEACNFYGLIWNSPFVLFENKWIALDALNDRGRLSLPQIADVIEAQEYPWTGRIEDSNRGMWQTDFGSFELAVDRFLSRYKD